MRAALYSYGSLACVVRSRWSRMRGVYESQLRSAHAELNAVAIVERRGRRYALLVNQSPVEAAKINEHVLTVATLNLRMTARDYCGCAPPCAGA